MINSFLPWIKSVVKKNPGVFPRGMRSVRLCMDGAKPHKCALKRGLMVKMGLTDKQLLAHPAGSPDFQGPVEWSHAVLKRAVGKQLRMQRDVRTPAGVKKVISEKWKEVVTSTWLKQAFKKLEHTYRNVVRAAGKWGSTRG